MAHGPRFTISNQRFAETETLKHSLQCGSVCLCHQDVLLHGHKQLHEEEAGKLADSLSNVTLKAIPRGAETELCWKETNEVVQGSRKPRMCVLDPSEHDSPRSLFVSDDVFDFPEQGAVELLAALHQLFDFPETVDKALRELFKLAFGPKGPEGIPDVLQKLKIDTKLQIRSSLQPGDIFPEELHSMLVPSVSVVFEARGSRAVTGEGVGRSAGSWNILEL